VPLTIKLISPIANILHQLALAIEQAAELIKNDAIGGPNIASTYDSFKDHQNSLPPRLKGGRSDTVSALDSLWNMRFTHLSRNSLALLSVLSLLSPGMSTNHGRVIQSLTIIIRWYSYRPFPPEKSECSRWETCVLQAKS
jgi:hypothetical protein